MAERRPLVRIDGRTKELPVGDTMPPDSVPAPTAWEFDEGGPSTTYGLGTIEFEEGAP